jgi:hypothetical protein
MTGATVDWKDEARDLREQGLSERAIAEAVGKAPSSVHEALAGSNGHGDPRELEREAGPAVGAMPTPGQQTIDGSEVQSVYVEQIRVDGTTQVAIDFGGKQAQTAKLTLSGAVEVDGFFRKGDRLRGAFEAVVTDVGAKDKIDRQTGIVTEATQTHKARITDLRVES